MNLHVAIATRSFRRYSTYTAATLAGIFTNCVFGVINALVLIAVWKQNPDAGGYDVRDAVTYVWIGQAMIMTVAVWGGGTPTDLANRIKTGDVALDFYRPVGILGWYLAADVGRAVFHLLSRGLAPTLVGAVALRPALPGRAPRLGGVLRERGAGAAGQLRDPLPGRHVGVLDPRRPGHPGPHERGGGVLQRPDRAAGAVPGLVRRAWPGRCPGRRTSRRRPTCGSARSRAGACSASSRSRRSGRSCCWPAAALLLGVAERKVVVQGG